MRIRQQGSFSVKERRGIQCPRIRQGSTPTQQSEKEKERGEEREREKKDGQERKMELCEFIYFYEYCKIYVYAIYIIFLCLEYRLQIVDAYCH